jgi:hypothetical protein
MYTGMAIEGPSGAEFRHVQLNAFVADREEVQAAEEMVLEIGANASVHPRGKAISPNSRRISELQGKRSASSFAIVCGRGY